MLVIENLSKIYPGGVAALSQIDLEVPVGMFGLLGPNGAGKSTLMKIIAGLLEPTTGRVLLDGEDITAEPEACWSKLGYLPQDFGLYPQLTGEEMLVYLLELKGVTSPKGVRKLAADLLDRVNLSHAAKRRLRDYSGGMRQRIGVAQAIAGDPRLIVVDEPTVGLDPSERSRFYRLLAELAQERIVILSTHIVEDVAVLCPHFALLRSGQLVAQASPGQMQRALEGKIFQAHVEADALCDIEREHEVTQSFFVAGRHHLRVYEPQGRPPEAFEAVPASLEDAYHLLLAGHDLESPSGLIAAPTERSVVRAAAS